MIRIIQNYFLGKCLQVLWFVIQPFIFSTTFTGMEGYFDVILNKIFIHEMISLLLVIYFLFIAMDYWKKKLVSLKNVIRKKSLSAHSFKAFLISIESDKQRDDYNYFLFQNAWEMDVLFLRLKLLSRFFLDNFQNDEGKHTASEYDSICHAQIMRLYRSVFGELLGDR